VGDVGLDVVGNGLGRAGVGLDVVGDLLGLAVMGVAVGVDVVGVAVEVGATVEGADVGTIASE